MQEPNSYFMDFSNRMQGLWINAKDYVVSGVPDAEFILSALASGIIQIAIPKSLREDCDD